MPRKSMADMGGLGKGLKQKKTMKPIQLAPGVRSLKTMAMKKTKKR
jgi:hypothetical protein